MKQYPIEQHIAWKRILEERTCPPLDLLEKGGKDIEAHLKVCAHCREILAEAKLYDELDATFPVYTATPEDQVGYSGEVRMLLRQAVDTLHDEHGWHNPPMVLLLPDQTGLEGLFRVAQIHDAPELKEEGDFPLPGALFGCFAESWNTFLAFVEDMSPAIERVSVELAEQVSRAAMEERYVPEEGSVIFSFRQQELNIGGFFGEQTLVRSIGLVDIASPASMDASSIFRVKPDTQPVCYHMEPLPMAAANDSKTANLDKLFGKPVPAKMTVRITSSQGVNIYEANLIFQCQDEGDQVSLVIEGKLPHLIGDYENPCVTMPTGKEVVIMGSELGNGKISLDLLLPKPFDYEKDRLLLSVREKK